MSQVPVSTSGLVRVTVASGTRRVDLVLPGAVPVAELVPELARSVGLLDSATVYGGYQLVTSQGRRLANDSGLTFQGIDDGSVITVTAGADISASPVYDDIVEAMTDVVEHDLKPWEPASGRRTALGAASMLMALGAAALLLQDNERLAAATAAVVALALVAAAVVLSRAQQEPEAAVTVAWMAITYAVVSGLLFAPDDDTYGYLLACAGLGAAVVAVACLIGLGQGRTLVVPAVVVGTIVGFAGLVVHNTGADLAVLLCVVLTFVVLVGSVFPWLALGVTSTTVDQLYSPADITADPDDVDPARVSADARVAHEILVAISATVGILIVFVAPFAVSRGLPGALLATVCALVVMFRTRQYRTGSEVLVGLVSGILGLATVAVAMLALRPEWRPAAAIVLAATGALLLTVTLLPSGPSLRRGRFGDVLETVALLSLLPLLVVASGLLGSITN